ncbi:H-NS family nucleoid-associated regulatory protein [Uliginosibacterium gangwonense]|uniref:H-NS histone family protein n=1 Tax=Uliginosibacterium gangwonense TaxID=392736 RepID=UPI000365689D|nr:H-NS histone family protein [Uliginosibacterium gangwonense]
MDISNLSLSELRRLQARVEAEISRRTDTTKRDLLKKVQKMASDAGVSLEDLIDSKPAAKAAGAKRGRKPKAAVAAPTAPVRGKKKGKVAPQYRHPDDASLQWTGRGRKPQWVAEQLATGKSMDDLKISKR